MPSDYVQEELDYIAERLIGVDSSIKLDAIALTKLAEEQGCIEAESLAESVNYIRGLMRAVAIGARVVAYGESNTDLEIPEDFLLND